MRDFSKAKKVVIKIGTNTLSKNNNIDPPFIKTIAKQVDNLIKQGKKCIIVSSGAIGFGTMHLKVPKSQDIKVRQALAGVGQGILMNEYAKAFAKYDINVAQILLTYDVLSERKTFLNLRNSINKMFEMGIVPIINENDSISIDEIGTKFGDNDRLSAMVASKIDADLLILLTDIDGLYTDNPRNNKTAKKLDIVCKITPEIAKYAGKAGSGFAVGGMQSKIQAAKIVTDAGCSMVIAYGRENNLLPRIISGEKIGTLFISGKRLSARERWIMNAKPKGIIHVNTCAEKVLKEGKVSLLPIGIERVEGNFEKGDVVMINDFARAVPDLGARHIDRIKGLKSDQACLLLGKAKKCRDEVVKRENIILLKK